METKPSDLLLSVLEFFGILIPGALFALMYGNFLLTPFALSMGTPTSAADWVLAFFVAYILGQFLLGFSVFMNSIAKRFISKETTAYFEAAKAQVKLPAELARDKPTLTNVFYSVYSFVRIHSPSALAELERQAGEYKLFRGLALLFLLDLPLSIASCCFSIGRLVSSLVVAGLAFYRFQWLLDWTYQLAFGFFLHLKEAGVGVQEEREA